MRDFAILKVDSDIKFFQISIFFSNSKAIYHVFFTKNIIFSHVSMFVSEGKKHQQGFL